MKVYYLDPDIYPGTYNFKDNAVDTEGTAITGVMTYSAAEDTYAKIAASQDGHKKVVKFYDYNNAGAVYIRTTFTGQDVGWIEIWLYEPPNNKFAYIYLREGSTVRAGVRWMTDGTIDYYTGAWNNIEAYPGETWRHIKIPFNTTSDTFRIWIDGVDKTGAVAMNGDATIIDNIEIGTGSTTTDYVYYIDAIGFSWDTDYTVGENLYKKWHVSTQTEVTNIVTYPNPVQQNNAFTACSMVLRDFEGSLYATWSVLDQVKMRIEDDSDNVIWRGLLDNKRFTAKGLTLELASFGKALQWKSFGSKEKASYIMDKGIVDLCNASSIIDLKDDDGNPFGWTPDRWIGEDKDLGFMIMDNTSEYTVTDPAWDISAITPTGHTSEAGGVVDTQTFDDGNYYYAKETGEVVDLVINLDIDGAGIPDTEELKSIEIQFNWRMRIRSVHYINKSRVKLQIKKGDEWLDKPISEVYKERLMSSTTTNWITGVPDDVEGGNGKQWTSDDENNDDELQKYFDKDNGNYNKLKGLRFVVSGFRGDDSNDYTQVYIDFIKIVVKHHAEDVLPIMYQITDNAATTITCSDVANWQLMGVTADSDRFYIGQNTRQITDDIASESGVGIEIIHDWGGGTKTFNIDPDGDAVPNDWGVMGAGATHTARLIDDVDANYIVADDDDDDEYEEFTFEALVLPNNCKITSVDVNIRTWQELTNGKCAISWDSGVSWSDQQNIPTTGAGWENKTITFTITEDIDSDDIANFQVQFFSGETTIASGVQITELDVDINCATHSFTKYMAREFKAQHCIDPLKAICKLEGAIWCEDHINERIKVLKIGDFEDSGVSLTVGGSFTDWEFEDQCNAIREVHVWGNSDNEVYANAKDPSVNSLLSEQIVDERIMTNADAQEIANDALALRKTKRPSIRIPLDGTNPLLVLGTYVNITFTRPTIAATDYNIRMIERVKFGKTGITTILHAGLGESIWDEKILKEIRLASSLAHKSMTDKL